MANEIQTSFRPGASVYALVRTPYSGGIWNGTGYEAYTLGNYATYPISMAEVTSGSAYYMGDFPTACVAGVFNITAKQQLGGSPAQTDPTIAVGEINWAASGGPIRALSDLMTSGQLGGLLPTKVTRGQALPAFMFKMVSSADHVTPFTSGVISGQINKDGAGFGPLQSGTQIAGYTEQGLGFYSVNFTSGDLNAGTIAINFVGTGVSGGTADPRSITIVTQRG